MRFELDQMRLAWIPAICLILTSCMLGPNFHHPAPPHITRYTEKPLPKQTAATSSNKNAGKSQQFTMVTPEEIPNQWWYLFHSKEINALVETGLANSPNLQAAAAALCQAQEAVNVQVGNSLYPAIDASLTGQRQKFAGASFGNSVPSSLFNIYNATVSVNYTLDVFGAARRQIEALQAQVDYQRYQFIAAYLTLTSNIVTTSVTIASLEEQIRATKELIRDEEDQLRIMKKQFAVGAITENTVLSQQTLVDQTRATLPALEKMLSQNLHALTALVGEFPDAKIPKIALNKLILPKTLPMSLPSDLVRQRPDVGASEALFHAAAAQVGVATANLFPQFTLSGNYGWSAPEPSTLFHPSTQVFTFGGQILQPVFHGGALRAQRREAIAAYDQAGAQYQQTVLTAFQNVADTLRALETDARSFRDYRQAELSAEQNFYLTKKQYQLGGVNFLNVLTAEQQYIQTKINRIKAQATRYADTAALYQAVGGGWWNCPECCCTNLHNYKV